MIWLEGTDERNTIPLEAYKPCPRFPYHMSFLTWFPISRVVDLRVSQRPFLWRNQTRSYRQVVESAESCVRSHLQIIIDCPICVHLRVSLH